jgi:hypothetical protein
LRIVLKGIFGYKGDEVTGECTAQQVLLGLVNKARRAWYVAGMGDRRSAYKF